MPILVQTVIDRCNALLDAEGSDHYTFDKDFIHAINNAQVWLTNLYNRLFGEKKVSEESLVELTVTRIFKTSLYSRLSFSNQGVVDSKTLTAAVAVNNGDGTARIPCARHGFARGGYVDISGTTNYDGTYQVVSIYDVNNFNILISAAIVNGDWNIADSVTLTRIADQVSVHHVGHGLVAGDVFTISGATQTEYNGTWTVYGVTSEDIYVYEITTTPATPATGTITSTTVFHAELFSITDTATQEDKIWTILAIYPSIVAIPTAAITPATVAITSAAGTATVVHAGHGFHTGDNVVIAGAAETEYNGTFALTRIDADSYSYTVVGAPASPATGTITAVLGLPDDDLDYSTLVTNVAMRKPLTGSATRLTLEEWGEKEVNPMIAGSPLITKANLIRYAYLNMMDYAAGAYELGNSNLELEISPDVSNELVALTYLREPVNITSVDDYLPFPRTMEELIVMKTLNFLAIKDDDQDDMYDLSGEEVTKAIQLLS